MGTFNFENGFIYFQSKLHHFALTLTHDPEYAWDLVQKANTKTSENKDKFENYYHPIKIGYAFLKNIFIPDCKEIKQMQNKAVYFDEDEQFDLEESESVKIYCDYDHILEIIRQLDEQSQKNLGLLIEEKRYAEISEILNMPEDMSKTDIHKIKMHLELALDELLKGQK